MDIFRIKMLKHLARSLALLAALGAANGAWAQGFFPTQNGSASVQGVVEMCLDQNGVVARPCDPLVGRTVKILGGVPIPPYPTGSVPITGIASGVAGAVVGTLAAYPGKSTYLCNVDVSVIGGTAAVGPIVIAGLTGGSFTYQASATVAGGLVLSRTFTPCLVSSSVNTAITITTTADGTASAVNVNASGFQF